MRRIASVLLALLLAGCAGRPAPAQEEPVAADAIAVKVDVPAAGPDLRAIQFADVQHGWAAGRDAILATADGAG